MARPRGMMRGRKRGAHPTAWRKLRASICALHISFGYVLLLVRLLVDASLRGWVTDVDPSDRSLCVVTVCVEIPLS